MCVGWMAHRTRVTDVDIVIQPGWSQVPINHIMELKEVVHDARDAYLTRVACEKMGTNLKLYRSLNTRPTPTIGLQAQLMRCMVAYSSATNDDLVGKISPKLLGQKGRNFGRLNNSPFNRYGDRSVESLKY